MTSAARTRRRCLGLALAATLSGSCAATRAGATVGPTAVPAAHEWHKDTLLGQEGFWALTLALEPDYDGPVSATLIRRPLHRERDCAVLYLHGYVDYFFQAHLADYYQYTLAGGQSGKGCDFFALDLRKYGRSLPPQYKYPNFAKNLDEYYPEITKALTMISGEGYPFVILNGHSTGALTAARYLQDGDRKRRGRRRLSQQSVSRLQRSRHLGVRRKNRPVHRENCSPLQPEIVRATAGTPSAC